ncbi:Rho guanine nucleotide exchange factor 8 [Camellia lanceoleosa]|uniref:Rho guanine nucleotide exchange factor 8 n=2 Tax=Camellia lanceoleosa TaxID=1840588 RepID=A0ACC0FEA2_9ERIC|nr:Rho guanine nucleotide exchange factor 8 [Camellia lanceoleosa]KAI7987384.1 Rho guanine nucleotide exchange factor 8 [Camellia lanceoleosa]
MVKEEQAVKSRSFSFKRIFEIPGRQVHSLIFDGTNGGETVEEKQLGSQGSKPTTLEPIGSLFNRSIDKSPSSASSKEVVAKGGSHLNKDRQPSDMELMKERFAKLLLGEDMSGGGKGVSSALALSNAITNLAASVFGEQRKLEPMSADRKARWKKEIDWLLSVTDYIVELVPSQQKSKDGTSMEIMLTQQRRDLLMNIPALRKLDAMLLDCLDNFKDQDEFWYVSRDSDEGEKGSQRDDKWWLPTVKVPPDGLSDASRKWMQFQKESVNQVLKASMAINAQILSEMEIPDNYIESLPKNGRSSLGDSIYKSITVEFFDPADFLSTMDMSTEHKVLDLKNRIEASIVIWKRKMHHKNEKSSWGSAISLEKRELFEERAETILLLLKQQFPGLPQSSLDISKIQYNRDVGYSILECYSRVLESLANTVMSRIEDVLYADSLTQNPSLALSKRKLSMDSLPVEGPGSSPSSEDMEKPNTITDTPNSMTLSDFMGWNLDQGETEIKKNYSMGNLQYLKEENEKLSKPPNIVTDKKISYIDKLEALGGLRSPTRF